MKKKSKEFSDQTDVDGCFYNKNFDNSQSQHRIVRISEVPNKKCFTIKFFQSVKLKTQQRYILQQKKKICKGTQFRGQQFARFSQKF